MTFDVAERLKPRSMHWHIQVHQIRIEVTPDTIVVPVPEGLHRDGHEFLAIHLVSRFGVVGGESVVCDSTEGEIARRTLDKPLDTLLINDKAVFHDVGILSCAGCTSPVGAMFSSSNFDHANDDILSRIL